MPIVTVLADLKALHLVIMEWADSFVPGIKFNILAHKVIDADTVLDAF